MSLPVYTSLALTALQQFMAVPFNVMQTYFQTESSSATTTDRVYNFSELPSRCSLSVDEPFPGVGNRLETIPVRAANVILAMALDGKRLGAKNRCLELSMTREA